MATTSCSVQGDALPWECGEDDLSSLCRTPGAAQLCSKGLTVVSTTQHTLPVPRGCTTLSRPACLRARLGFYLKEKGPLPLFWVPPML